MGTGMGGSGNWPTQNTTTASGTDRKPGVQSPWRVFIAVAVAVIIAAIFGSNSWPWYLGAIIGGLVGYWWKILTKIAIALAIIAIGIALIAYLVKQNSGQ